MELLTRSRNWRVAIGQRRPAYGDVLGTGVHVQKVPRYQGTIKLYPCDWVGFFAQQTSDTLLVNQIECSLIPHREDQGWAR